MKHAFAILAHKESPHLEECIDSLKNQTIASKIIICTSTPNAFLDRIAKKNSLPIHVNPERDGIATDWNFALASAGTEYVTLAHQDDIYSPDYAAKMMKAAEMHADALIIFSNYDELICKNDEVCIRKHSLNFFIKNTLLRLSFWGKDRLAENKKRLLAFGSPIGCPTVTFGKSLIGDFKFDDSFGINMDWKAWYDLARKEGSFIWVKKNLVSHRIYAGSETSRGISDNRRQKEDLEMFEKIWPDIIAKMLSKIYALSYKNNINR